MKKTFLFLVCSLLLPFIITAQDTIVKKNGVNLICKIQNQDNSTIYFTIERNGQKLNNPIILHSSIDKNEVQSIHFYNPQHRTTSNKINSSNEEKDNSLNLSVGLSAAIGDFGNQDVNSSTSGLAGNGININGVFSHKFTKRIGLSLKGYFNSNSFSTNLLANQMSSTSGYDFTSNNVSYTGHGMMIGPDFITSGKRCSFVSRFLIGFSSLTEPESIFTVNSGGNSGSITMPEITQNAFVYNIGGGLLFTIASNWYFIINVDYIRSQYTFGNIILSSSTGATQSFDRGSQPYEVINASAGFGVRF